MTNPSDPKDGDLEAEPAAPEPSSTAADASAKPPADYAVGYGKPPLHSRFQPGQSGNPRGRPKGTKNLKTDLEEELSERVLVREGETSRWITKQRAWIKTLAARSMKGDMRAASLLGSLMMRLLDTGADAPEVESGPDEADAEVLRAYVARQLAAPARLAPDPDDGDEEDAA